MFKCFRKIAYRTTKRCLDIVGSGAGLAVTAPLWLPAAAAVRLTMGSPIFFRQTRPGLGGHPFEMLKFRTMREPKPGEDRLKSDADRLTPVGAFLRETSIDELPTLFNVLEGDMSLVGPRPLLMRYLDRYTPEQARRHEVKPGVTGWAQVNGRNALSWEEKFAHDVWYVDHQSLLLDVKILAMTVAKVLAREGIAAEGEATMTEFMGTDA
ncbi:sugar transferase [Persicimonas caeni]|uniref:Sugar transferase n=1 Tax=Persicimonas caeni TaxID=2292766 RepID=A0A4Y6PTM0_PERCE|nr:sugar transferase [Persicimonas caeni]QDG51672.1 sugar transferase [Persicimonas caeni]QED32893.1 sugar transferase [Persicimonas caeni]